MIVNVITGIAIRNPRHDYEGFVIQYVGTKEL